VANGGLKVSGTKLVIQGLPSFLGGHRQANDAVKRTGQATEEAGRQAERASSGFNILKQVGDGLAIGFGVGLFNALMMVGQGFLNLGKQSIDAVSNYERMAMSLESLVAKELRTADATLSMGDALEQAGPKAEQLLAWIERLAIESPFDQAGVQSAFRTAMAYNFTAQEAQRLTEATINFSAATGATTHTMNSITLALGQIKAKGKLAGQEIMQLTNAGVSVVPVLESMGFTLDDVSKGLVNADAFILAFVESLENDFGNAAERQSETLSGLLNSLGDLQEMSMRSFFMPIFQELTPHVGALVSKFQELIPTIKFFGETIAGVIGWVIANKNAIGEMIAVVGSAGLAFYVVVNAGTILSGVIAGLTAIAGIATAAISALATAIAFLASPIGIIATAVAGLTALFVLSFSDMKEQIGGFSSSMSDDMFSFGHDLVISFAEGMAAAINAVLDVLISIGNAIAEWLAPGSPPKILPEIDDWGTSAMNEFIGGMSNADFGALGNLTNKFSDLVPINLLRDMASSINDAMQDFDIADFGLFDKLSGSITNFMKSLGQGVMPETDLVPALFEAKEAIADAINELNETGQVGEEAFQKIFDSIGETTPELEGYVRALFKSQQATERVKQAQKELNDVTRQYDEMMAPMQAELDAIAKRRQEVIDDQRKQELESILSDENAPALAKELAMMELREIELKKQMRTTKEQKKLAVSAAEENLKSAMEAEDQANEELALKENLVKAQVESNKLIKEQIDLMKKLAKQGGGGGGKAKKPKKPKLGKPKLPDIGGMGIGGVATDLQTQVGGALDDLKGRISGFVEEIRAPFEGIKEKVNDLKTSWANAFLSMALRAGEFVFGFNAKVEAWRINIEQIKTITELLKENLDAKWTAIKTSSGALFDQIGETVSKKMSIVSKFISDGWQKAKDFTSEKIEAMKTAIGKIFNSISDSIKKKLEGIQKEGASRWEDLKERWSIIFEDIKLILTTVFTKIKTFIIEKLQEALDSAVEKLDKIKNKFNTAWNKAKDFVTTSLTSMYNFVVFKMQSIKSTVETKMDAVKQKFEDIWETIKTSAESAVTTVVDSVTQSIDGVIAAVGEKAEDFSEIGANIMSAIGQAILDNVGDVMEAMTSVIEDVIQWAKDLLGIESPSKVFMEIGDNVTAGLVNSIERGHDIVKGAFGGLVGSALELPMSGQQVSRGQSTTNNNISITGVGEQNVSSGMDIAMLEALIIRTIHQELAL